MVSEQVETGPVTAIVVPPDEDAPREVAIPVVAPPTATVPTDRRWLVAVWIAVMVAFAVFVGVASVRREAGRVAGELRVARAWTLLAENLPDGTAVRVLVWGAFGVFVVAAGLGLWLALTAGAAVVEAPPHGRSDVG